MYKISVSNGLGVVFESMDYKDAVKTYEKFVEKSNAGFGQIGHEDVVMTRDGDVVMTHKWSKDIK